jgi:hypothetical protein
MDVSVSPKKNGQAAQPDPLGLAYETCRSPSAVGFADAWVGLEPTFQTRKSVRLWKKMWRIACFRR